VEVHLRAAVHDALATDRLGATDEMAVFGTHPYRRSSGLARGFPDSHVEKQRSHPGLLFVVHAERLTLELRDARNRREGNALVSAAVGFWPSRWACALWLSALALKALRWVSAFV
jgi:hypothetical protein